MDNEETKPAERRRQKRQSLELPLQLLSIEGIDSDLKAFTRNISSGGGVFFHSPAKFVVGSNVKYVVTLSEGDPPVKIACAGRVARCEQLGSDAALFEVAFTMTTYRFLSKPASNAPAETTPQPVAS